MKRPYSPSAAAGHCRHRRRTPLAVDAVLPSRSDGVDPLATLNRSKGTITGRTQLGRTASD